jgi:hypothetical protein
MDGGRISAGGYLYQYLRTAEAVLLALDADARVHACRVEGAPAPVELGDTDIVDFDLVDRAGKVLRSAQVKSGNRRDPLGPSAVFAILARLVEKGDAEEYVLLTSLDISAAVAEVTRALDTGVSPDERRAALRPLLRGTAGQHLDRLTDAEIQRLGRCRVSVDHRSRQDLRDALLGAVRDLRRRDGRGIGETSGGLLLDRLHWEIHRRAASPEDAVWAMSDVRDVLRLDDHALAQALWDRDWGGVLGLMPPIPDVPRTTVLDEIASFLSPFRPAGRTVGRCALTGLSGIGKSSMAARYTAEYLDAYNMVFWFDASNAPSTLVEGFREAAEKLSADPDVSAERLRAAVHDALSRMAGRWLIIFDDAQPKSISPWVPRVGDGDVLFTSIDSSHRFGTARPVPIDSMSPKEASRLLAARLNLTGDQEEAHRPLIERLAAGLDYWPLALELAAGYMHSCGYSVTDIPHYLDQLKLRSLDDRDSVPDGYPATLIAAIDLAASRLAGPGTDPVIRDLAADLIMEGAYLSSRRIPLHLLASAGQADLDSLPGDRGPVVFEDPRVHEAVRVLGRASFSRRDQPLPRRETDLPTAEYTISFNSVLQEVLRDRAESSPEFPTWKATLERLAYHLDHWLASAGHNGEADKLHALAPHAEVLVGHLDRLGLTSPRIPILIGNLAGFYLATGDCESATDLLRTELRFLLSAAAPNDFHINQARLHLSQALTAGEPIEQHRADEAISNLEPIAVYSQRLAAETSTHNAVVHFCTFALETLKRIAESGLRHPSAPALVAVFTETLGRVPPTWETGAREAGKKASDLISADRAEEAEAVCRPYLAPLQYGSNLQLEIHRLLIEALLYQQKWDEAGGEVSALADRLGVNPIHRRTAEDTLHNIGLPLATWAVVTGNQQASDMFSRLMSAPCFVSVRNSPSTPNSGKFAILNLSLAVIHNSVADIARYLPAVKSAMTSDTWVTESPPFMMLGAGATAAAAAL